MRADLDRDDSAVRGGQEVGRDDSGRAGGRPRRLGAMRGGQVCKFYLASAAYDERGNSPLCDRWRSRTCRTVANWTR